MASSSQATLLLREQLKEFQENSIRGFSAWEVADNNILEWKVTFFGLPGTLYESGFYNAMIRFPEDYPYSPPVVRFTSEIWHPNVSPDGKVGDLRVCPPGNNPTAYEPIYTVESTVLRIISMLAIHIPDSPVAAKKECSKTEDADVVHNFSVTKSIYDCCSSKDTHDFVLKSLDGQFKCDGCKQQGSGPRYRCEKGNFELHKECKSPKASTSHEFFGNSKFQFFKNPQFRDGGGDAIEGGPERYCDACGNQIEGFNYHCVAKGLDLHPCCSKLKKKLVFDDTLFELHKEVLSSKCNWCQEKKFLGGGKNIPMGWSYSSRTGDFQFHVPCMMEWVHSMASVKDGNSLGLQKIKLKHLAKFTNKKGKKGNAFLSTIKTFLKTIISILLGDPTALLAATLVELIFHS